MQIHVLSLLTYLSDFDFICFPKLDVKNPLGVLIILYITFPGKNIKQKIFLFVYSFILFLTPYVSFSLLKLIQSCLWLFQSLSVLKPILSSVSTCSTNIPIFLSAYQAAFMTDNPFFPLGTMICNIVTSFQHWVIV